MDFTKLKTKEQIEKVIENLSKRNISAEFVENGAEAKKRVLELVSEGAEVMTYTSKTLDEAGISQEINESGKYISVRNELNKLNRETDGRKMQQLGAAPEYALGSVHAVTEDGEIVIVSNTGSQLPAYVYGASKVIWVVSTAKIVKDKTEADKRIHEHTLPLENERVKEAYGMPHSNIRKTLIIDSENNPERIRIIFVNENLGY